MVSGPSMLLSSAVTVSVTVPAVSPAGMVNEFGLSLTAAGSAETVTVVSWLDGWLSVAVSVLCPPFSPIGFGASSSVTVGAGSSS